MKELYSLEKVRLLGMKEGISLKKDRNRWERGALFVNTNNYEKDPEEKSKPYIWRVKVNLVTKFLVGAGFR